MIARELRLFRIALQFLTQVPAGSIDDWPPDWLARSAKYMPFIGAVIGLIAGTVLVASAIFFPEPLPTVIGLAVAIGLSGAMHEDGLADTVDAFGGGKTRERRLEIMKDSRIGTYGALGLIVVLALKGAALVAVDPVSAASVLIAGHAGARLAAVMAMSMLPHAGINTKISHKRSELTMGEVALAAILGLTPGLIVLHLQTFAIATLFAFVAAALVAALARKKIGGYTGDVLGAVEQVYETVFFMFAAALISGPG
ncbi:adenosylcobinamide-GDP ribazoletransferase [Hyphomicrobium sp.]|jgi:adenosylcobinamide-GDP ribazoletransferase|uniref:adenosylcobinamide-GDP ribazoletransferase n=1 Tax=Hyphomicrobium sp. TaxID=82 RepID=UPI002C701CB8|nr:adenosylcobinamide-GDP ribazoletransferase [Hyphomicrobium sp.]HVZ03465.1 adenosylcobinamide-GDP ribazoletransferase [Hyphomicrobium sp.]